MFYNLPHKFEVHEVHGGGYTLTCNGHFVFWNKSINEVFIVFGKHLEGIGR